MMSGVFQKWMKDWDIMHRPSSAYFPHSNMAVTAELKPLSSLSKD
jgi:hypothetical protein